MLYRYLNLIPSHYFIFTKVIRASALVIRNQIYLVFHSSYFIVFFLLLSVESFCFICLIYIWLSYSHIKWVCFENGRQLMKNKHTKDDESMPQLWYVQNNESYSACFTCPVKSFFIKKTALCPIDYWKCFKWFELFQLSMINQFEFKPPNIN